MNSVLRVCLSSLVIVLLPTPSLAEVVKVQERVVIEPPSGVSRTVSVGSTLHEKSRYLLVEETVTTVDSEMKGGRWLLPLTITSEEPLTQVTSKAKYKACTGAGGGPCDLDDDGDGKFDRMAQDDASMALKLKQPIKYTTRHLETIRNDPKNLKQLILYAGATSDTLRLSYREFVNDMARPAFTEELTIPISKTFPQLVAVKSIKLRLEGIDGLGLRYALVD